MIQPRSNEPPDPDSEMLRSRVGTDAAQASGREDTPLGATIPAASELADRALTKRRTPRFSLVVVLAENHVVHPESLAEGLRGRVGDDVDVLVACAGQPTNLPALQRSIGDAQFLLAPAGTSPEQLREIAIREAPGDIVRLLNGALLREASGTDRQLTVSS
jgi:hypothetical protein